MNDLYVALITGAMRALHERVVETRAWSSPAFGAAIKTANVAVAALNAGSETGADHAGAALRHISIAVASVTA